MGETMPNPFDGLPIETRQHLAGYLDDATLCNYRLVCQSTHDAVDADSQSFWRRRFLESFEKPTWTGSNIKYKQVYQIRRKALMYGADFDLALSKPTGRQYVKDIKKGTKCLEVLRDIIVDSFSEKTDDGQAYESQNLNLVYEFIRNHDLLHAVLVHERANNKDIHCLPKRLLFTIWVVLAPAMLSLEFEHLRTFQFPDSQLMAYGTAEKIPIFGGCNGLDINMEWVLHLLNFWKYHMLRAEENTLYHAYKQLEEDEMPRFWDRQLKSGGNVLGKRWKGSYAYVERDEIDDVRNSCGYETPVQDLFNGDADEGQFQDMRLEWIEPDAIAWPPLFEQHLHSLKVPESRAKTRAQHRSATPDAILDFKSRNFQFNGEGSDTTEEFCALGWLNALPPQQGIPGWQRMTMMKFFQDPDTGVIDREALWAYEGVVLPGGQIIVGRWWSPNDGTGDEMYSGPFILWCVDAPKYGDAVDE